MTVKILTKEQIERLLSQPDRRTERGRRDVAMMGLMALGGLRISEVTNLRRDEVIVDDGRTRLVFAGKGGKVRTVTLPEKAAVWLNKYMLTHTSPYAFPGRYGPHSPISANAAWRTVTAHAEAAGLPKWFHPHSLRHTYATALIRSTSNLHLVQRVLGHSSPQTTATYYLAFDRSDADKAAEVFE